MSINVPPLRPLGIGDILDRAVRIYRRNFVTLVSIIAVISLPLLLIQVLAAALTLPWLTNSVNGDAFAIQALGGLFFLAQFVTVIVTFFATIFQVGAIAAFVSEQLKGRTLSLREAYGQALRRGVSLVIATVLLGLVIVTLLGVLFVPFLLPLGISSIARSIDDSVLGIMSVLVCCFGLPLSLIYLYLSVRWMFYGQAIVVENYNSTGGLGRSWKLVKGKFWRTLGFYLILAILVIAFTTGPIYLLTFFSFLIPSLALATIMNSVAQTLLQVIILPIQYVALTLYYFDLRVRQEGYDLELQLEQDPDALLPLNPPSLGATG